MRKIISCTKSSRHLSVNVNGFDQEENEKITKELKKLTRKINFLSKNRNGKTISYEIIFN